MVALAFARRAWSSLTALGALSFASPIIAAPPDPLTSVLTGQHLTGVDAWHRSPAPGSDGSGVVIAILDTGIDPTAVGIAPAPGEPHRVVAMRDFSAQGHVALHRVRPGDLGPERFATTEGAVTGLPAGIKPPRGDDHDPLWLGFFSETRLGDAAARDLNRNGRDNDRFALAVWLDPADRTPRVAIDLDGDGRLDDEIVRRNWEDAPESFVFQTSDTRSAAPPVGFGLHIDLRRERAELIFDDGGHGTHCAGIAAARGLHGRTGVNGVAPGARLMALKIGDNRLAGGATTDGAMLDAVRFASDWAARHETPVVINLSYGIAARDEGMSTIEAAIDAELARNPRLLMVVSASNDGPGLSTVGNPAGARLVWTAGAALTGAQADALLGAGGRGARKRAAATLFAFSSRGGELAKPDGVTPGIASSAMPPFASSNTMAGTSMAAPHAAGILALLVGRASAASLRWTPFDVRRALTASAKPLAGASILDQGAGVVDVVAAWKHLSAASARNNETTRVLAGFRVTTAIPHRPGRHGSASFWRVAGQPTRAERQVVFDVAPLFHTDTEATRRDAWFVDLQLTSDAPWVRIDRSRLVMRGGATSSIKLRVDFSGIADKPGLHVARVIAHDGVLPAFVLPVVVVVPLAFDSDQRLAASGTLEPGGIARLFVTAPWPASSIDATFDVNGRGRQEAFLFHYQPSGFCAEPWELQHVTDVGRALATQWSASDFGPGVHELVIHAGIRNDAPLAWRLDLATGPIPLPESLEYRVDSGRAAEAALTLTHHGALWFEGTLEAVVDGWERVATLEVQGGRATHTFAVGPDERGPELELSLTDESWNRVTDVAVRVRDENGRVVRDEAIGGERLKIALPDRAGSWTVEVLAARTTREDAEPLRLSLRERHLHARPIVWAREQALTLFPGVPVELSLQADRTLPELPDDFVHVGRLSLQRDDGAPAGARRVVFTRDE